MASTSLPLTTTFASRLVALHYPPQSCPVWVNYPIFLQSNVDHIVRHMVKTIRESRMGEGKSSHQRLGFSFLFLDTSYRSIHAGTGAARYKYLSPLAIDKKFNMYISEEIYQEVVRHIQMTPGFFEC